MVRYEIKLQFQAMIAALQFLTRIPIPMTVPFEGPVLMRSVIYFPLAGGLIGAITAGAAWLLDYAVPAWPGAVLVLALWTALSGGLHIDGWMDTADGVLSHRTRERMLEIMKDSRVGAMGVVAAVLLLLLKVTLLAEILQSDKLGIGLCLLILCSVWSRAWMAVAIAGWPSARQGEGIGALFNGVNRVQAAFGLLLSALLSWMVMWLSGLAFGAGLAVIFIAIVVMAMCGSLLAVWFNRKLGGLTGDTYGAMNEAIEAMLLLAAVIGISFL